MQRVTYKITPDPAKNSIGYSKNYRIFTTGEPVRKALRAVQPNGYKEEIDFGSANPANIIRKFRYSTDRSNWSLWYSYSPDDLSELYALEFEESNVFFEIKFEYDDGTFDQLEEPLRVEWVKLFLMTNQNQGEDYNPPIQCSEELCPMLVAESQALFKPYEAFSAIQIAKEMSLQTNKIYGHDVIYFKTEPDRDSADFIFKEWTLFKTTTRRCIKVMVPENKFPDNKPIFGEYGPDFEIPFELHIDNVYFQQMFGRNAQPRKRDYLYFPLLNRMYEIQGSYLYRGFMMEPIFWKIQLVKFKPNIDMFMKNEDRQFLDNLIMSTDDLFGKEAAAQTADALNPQQNKTISNKYDETRRAIHQDLKIKLLSLTYNYSPLIEYYYEMSSVVPRVVKYPMESFASPSQPKSQNLTSVTPPNPVEIYAYEDSEIFGAWKAREISTGDSNTKAGSSSVKIKMNGPKDSFSGFGHYVVVEGYQNLGLKSTQRKSIQTDANVAEFVIKENAVTYKKAASTVDNPSATYSSLIRFSAVAQDIIFFQGYDDYLKKGIKIVGEITLVSQVPHLTVHVTINDGDPYTFAVGTIEFRKWYAMIVPFSGQFGQLQVSIYSLTEDPANVKNFNGITRVFNDYRKIGPFEYETTANYCLPSANYQVANIRLFNTMVQDEDHEFVISQLFLRDESTISIIDNARPRLNAPFVAINR